MHPLSGPFIAAMLLLMAAGLAKAVEPSATVGALRAVSWPGGRRTVRAMGAVEATVAILSLAGAGWWWRAAAAAAYLGFAGFVVVALRAGTPLRSCGCFGKVDTPPSVAHLLVNVAAAAVAGLMALDGRPAGTGAGVGSAVAIAAASGALAYLLYVGLTVWPATMATVRRAAGATR